MQMLTLCLWSPPGLATPRRPVSLTEALTCMLVCPRKRHQQQAASPPWASFSPLKWPHLPGLGLGLEASGPGWHTEAADTHLALVGHLGGAPGMYDFPATA